MWKQAISKSFYVVTLNYETKNYNSSYTYLHIYSTEDFIYITWKLK